VEPDYGNLPGCRVRCIRIRNVNLFPACIVLFFLFVESSGMAAVALRRLTI
jgi:hypothetical protein